MPPSPVKHRMGLYSFDEVDVLDMPYGSDSIETDNCQSISYITVQSFVEHHTLQGGNDGCLMLVCYAYRNDEDSMYDLDIGYSSYAFSQAPTYTGDDISEALEEEKELREMHETTQDDNGDDWIDKLLDPFFDFLLGLLDDDE